MATSSKKAYAIPRTTAPRAPAPTAVLCWLLPPQETPKHSSVSISEVLWVLVSSTYVWALWASLVDIGFDSKCDFSPPAILLGLLLCPWTWGISSKLLQHGKVAAPVPSILLGLLYPWTWGISSQPLQCHTAITPAPWMSRSLWQRHGLAVPCCRVGGTECSCAFMGTFEGGHHYLHYLYHSLASGQITGREHSPTLQQKIGLKIYWT